MLTRSTLLHLRIPFSYFLTPIFLLALSFAPQWEWPRAFLVFVILHLLLYPASNSFNTYYDRDEESIGGLKNPPPVSAELLTVSLVFDAIALLLGLLINWQFVLYLLFYGLCSKAYSYDKIRLKQRPLASWLGTGLVQGSVTFLAVIYAVQRIAMSALLQPALLIPAGLLSGFLMASYPLTQVYQHQEDRKRGDRTLSLLLGIKGTFLFTGGCFVLVTVGFLLFYILSDRLRDALLFAVCLLPALVYFLYWLRQVDRDERAANYTHTMRLNLIAATALNVFSVICMGLADIN